MFNDHLWSKYETITFFCYVHFAIFFQHLSNPSRRNDAPLSSPFSLPAPLSFPCSSLPGPDVFRDAESTNVIPSSYSPKHPCYCHYNITRFGLWKFRPFGRWIVKMIIVIILNKELQLNTTENDLFSYQI